MTDKPIEEKKLQMPIQEVMTKQQAYEKATLLNLPDSNGTRMDIIFSAMEIYSNQFRYQQSPSLPVVNYVPHQLCPKCLGEGIVPSSGTATTKQCDVCFGSKIIPMYPVKDNTVEDELSYRNKQNEIIGNLTTRNTFLQDSEYRRDEWLRKAKKEAGFDNNVSFDEVWKKVLAAYKSSLQSSPVENSNKIK